MKTNTKSYLSPECRVNRYIRILQEEYQITEVRERALSVRASDGAFYGFTLADLTYAQFSSDFRPVVLVDMVSP